MDPNTDTISIITRNQITYKELDLVYSVNLAVPVNSS